MKFFTDPKTGETVSNPFNTERREELWRYIHENAVPIDKNELLKSIRERQLKREAERKKDQL